ncbi:Inner membrane protein YjjP [Vibrio stylophorae]|uniref:Inner membrane protein YjjP n=1 Tax=Vibrio stylophorae TaxID=659351 RepID=A0ABM8ZR59_9VIBR|nr:threonine/serine exporter family protein [Vibrio stylophorae]CAH0532561.1 Inner membrane protein YjjP [Vibrio stylophorae]
MIIQDVDAHGYQRKVTQLAILAGQMLLQHGAESALVADISRRFAYALGAKDVAVSLTANSLTLTTIINDNCMTTVRECPDKGINMRAVTQIQRTCILTEKGLLDATQARYKLDHITPRRYNRWLVVLMIGLSCAAFCRLAGGDIAAILLTFLASSCGMIVRQEMGHRHFNPSLNFAVTAFVTTLVAGIGEKYQIGDTPFLAMASSVLMLVPGFPLINTFADMVKGYINMGIARFTFASLLTLATCIGIVAAMKVLGVWGWII